MGSIHLLNSWTVQTPEVTGPASWLKDGACTHLSGVVAKGQSGDIGILPKDARPQYDSVFVCVGSSGYAEVTVRADGLIACKRSMPDEWIALNNVHFV